MMDQMEENDGCNDTTQNNYQMKYPFNSSYNLFQPDNFMSVKKFSNFYPENDIDVEIQETHFSSNIFSSEENLNAAQAEEKEDLD